ncbi:hypothetical protein Patl1_08485 [Pistacia atlantica]|uniref:Uncharacterized protein n=1 Tax=Pistacia atlantica TaxID=434234 RepID=A0ACC1AHW6_9ROSI|nr:hypothetical protein Patl1_08485 [Pistacia atlantica]
MELLIVLLFLPILLLFLLQTYKTKNIRSPPGPKGVPLISNLHQFDNSNFKPLIMCGNSLITQKYDPLMSLRIGSMSTLIVSSAKMAKEVLKTHDLAFCSRPASATISSHSGEDEVSRMIQKISKSVAASKPVNLSELLMSMTSSIICRLAFGKRLHETGAMLGSFFFFFFFFFFSDYFPFMGWVDKLTGMKRRLENNFKELDIFFQKEDIIDIFLQIRKDGGLKVDITWDHIKAVLMVMYIFLNRKNNFIIFYI